MHYSSSLRSDASDGRPHVSLPLLGFSVAATAGFLYLAGRTLVRNGLIFYQTFGFYSPSYDVNLYRFVMFGLIPFGFNAAFCGYFGLAFFRRMVRFGDSREGVKGALRILNAGLYGFVAWCVLFNVPSIAISLGEGWHRGWPPRSLPSAIYYEMLLFYPMGNLGAFSGFCCALLGAQLSHLRGRDK